MRVTVQVDDTHHHPDGPDGPSVDTAPSGAAGTSGAQEVPSESAGPAPAGPADTRQSVPAPGTGPSADEAPRSTDVEEVSAGPAPERLPSAPPASTGAEDPEAGGRA